jgi:hypothetical protein
LATCFEKARALSDLKRARFVYDLAPEDEPVHATLGQRWAEMLQGVEDELEESFDAGHEAGVAELSVLKEKLSAAVLAQMGQKQVERYLQDTMYEQACQVAELAGLEWERSLAVSLERAENAYRDQKKTEFERAITDAGQLEDAREER